MIKKNPSTSQPLTDGPSFPPSVQMDLFSYLKPEQQEFIRPILRVLKKPAQEDLCYSLLDYLEFGEVFPPSEFTTRVLFFLVTCARGDIQDDPSDKKILRPLHYRSHVPQETCGERVESID